MQEIRPDKRTFWKINHANGSVINGFTDLGQVTTSGHPITYDTNADNVFQPLPEVGVELKEGEVYSFETNMLVVLQDHLRGEISADYFDIIHSEIP